MGSAASIAASTVTSNTKTGLIVGVAEKALATEFVGATAIAEANVAKIHFGNQVSSNVSSAIGKSVAQEAGQRFAVFDKNFSGRAVGLLAEPLRALAVKTAMTETTKLACNALATKAASVARISVAAATVNVAEVSVVTPAIKVRKTPEEIEQSKIESKMLSAERIEKQRLEGLAKKEETRLAKVAEGEVAKPSKWVSYEVFHPEHCPLESGELMDLWHNDPPKLMPHPLITFKPLLDIEGAKHILSPEITRKTDKFGNTVEAYSGCHFSPNGRMDKYLSDKVVDEVTGVIKATVSYGNIKPAKDKTFFPVSWTVKQMFYEVKTAMLNLVREPMLDRGSIVFIGEGSSGINIRMVFEKDGRLVTAYPVLEIK